jgi:eukaryotic-like serine/threonine-protein kinase
MHKQLAAFVDGIRQSGLLAQEQVDQIVAWADAPNVDPQVVAREIVQRDWLTAFQVKLFWKGRGNELFINQYVLVDRLGEGGMGEVFRARHRRMDRIVALKIIRKERLSSPDAVRRFLREIMAAAHLTHENVVMAYDADQAGDRHFFAMEFIDGTNLARLVREKGPLPVEQACNCIRQAAVGLQHAFERGMVHRDIKPSNLLLSNTGVVKILDMGLARVESEGSQAESRITQEGLVIGTPDYLAPEQARNARTADIRSDIYALGCTFHYLLTASPPFPGSTPTEKLLRHSTDPIPNILRPDLPPAVEVIVHKMMAKRPDERFQTPDEIAFALQPYSGLAPPVDSSMHTAPPANPLTSSKYAPVAPQPDDSETDSHFRLPPVVRRRAVPERTRWNMPIALAAGVAILALAAGGIYLALRKKPEAASPPSSSVFDKEFTNHHDMKFVLIPAGKFDMGSNDVEDEGPIHAVEITRPFYLGTTEVTRRQYQAVMGQLPREYALLHKGKAKASDDELDRPVTSVTFEEARAFCKKLNSDSGKKDGWEYRLPREAEWEYACRAGTTTPFHFGTDLTRDQALFGENGQQAPGKTGQFSANAWGLFDMHGNVAEWVNDRYDEKFYANSPSKDPYFDEVRRAKSVIRGGGYNDPSDACRSAKRRAEYGDSLKSFPTVGFRVAIVQVSKQPGQ